MALFSDEKKKWLCFPSVQIINVDLRLDRVFSLKMHAYASVNVGGGRLCVRMTSGENDSKLQISTSFDSLRELCCVLKR